MKKILHLEIIFACLAALLAGFVDSIVGGGGLVQVPALFILFPHFSVPQVIGTNRFASFVGTSVAGYQYARKVEVPWRVVLVAAVGTAIMSYLGATIARYMKAEVLKPLILVLMTAIAIYTYSNKKLGHHESLPVSLVRLQWYALLVGMATGFYNGFVGPGTGSLLVFGFVSLIGYEFLRASAIAAANWGRSALRPDSTSTNSATTTAPRSAASCWSFERWASRPRPLSPWRAVETR